jgi:LmbE family N-acetylglucosaminyl deacetylase
MAVPKRLTPPESKNKRALVAVAHADDLLLFVGGTICALVKDGWQIAVVRATDDRWDSYQLNEEKTITANKTEFNQAMNSIGLSKFYELGLATDQLGDYSEVELRKQLIKVIREFKPYLIITFDPDSYLYEDNEDHKLVAKAMAEANWAAGFDKHPNSGDAQLPPHLPVAKWYFGRQVAKPTHYFDVTKHLGKAISAAMLHETMLKNMARQLELKLQTIEDNSKVAIDLNDQLDKFATKIMKSSRINQVKGVEYAEIFRVIDDSKLILKLAKEK